MKKVVWMFSGQGAQYHSMAEELYRTQPVFRSALERGDAVVRPLINASVVEEIYRTRDRALPFRRTLFTHPAILLIEWALAEYLGSLHQRPDAVLGYSLGELTSLVVSGSLSIEDALVLVVKKAELVEYLVAPGGMLAVLDAPDLMDRQPQCFRGLELAAVNFRNNFVVAGPSEAIQSAQTQLKALGVVNVALPVSHSFHSKEMKPIDVPMRHLLDQIVFRSPKIPVISATLGRVTEVAKDHFYRVTREPVRFARVLEDLEAEGSWLYVDLGPSGSMVTAVKYNLPPGSRSEFLALVTPFGQEQKNIDRYLDRVRH